jgi:hypothetical protein
MKMPVGHNTYSKPGAGALAKKISAYWKARGYSGIETWVEPVWAVRPEDQEGRPYQVRSNIGPSGFPPRKSELAAA